MEMFLAYFIKEQIILTKNKLEKNGKTLTPVP